MLHVENPPRGSGSTLTRMCALKGLFLAFISELFLLSSITMLSHYFTLKCVAEQLDQRLRDFTVAETFSQNKNELLISLVSATEGFTIQASCETRSNHIFLRERVTRAKRNSIDLFPDIVGRRIVSVLMSKFDRIVEIRFDNNLTLYLNFFGSRSNFYLVNERGTIIASFKRSKEIAGRPFTLERETPILLTGVDGFDLFCEEFHKQTESKNLTKASTGAIAVLGSTLAREILHRAQLDANTDPSSIQTQQLRTLWELTQEIFHELQAPVPTVYFDEHGPHTFSLIALHHLSSLRSEHHEDISDAIRLFVSRVYGTKTFEQEKHEIVEPLKKALEKEQRTAEKMKAELITANRAALYEKFGNLLMANLSSIPKGAEEIELMDATDGKSFKIPLDPSIPPLQNAVTYFGKAKKAKAAQESATRRLIMLSERLRMMEEMLAAALACATREMLKTFVERYKDELSGMGIIRGTAQTVEVTLFRRFIVAGGFEVWAGKNSRNNDLLTMKHARQNDLWFHARGAGGSHVILRRGTGKGEPSRETVEQTASIAAYYSRARASKIVPVVMTERKYVRKRKHAPEGEVLVEREKLLFVRPKLPE